MLTSFIALFFLLTGSLGFAGIAKRKPEECVPVCISAQYSGCFWPTVWEQLESDLCFCVFCLFFCSFLRSKKRQSRFVQCAHRA